MIESLALSCNDLMNMRVYATFEGPGELIYIQTVVLVGLPTLGKRSKITK